jgi:hypothetical protein
MCQELTPEMVRVLVNIAMDDQAPAAACATCAMAILDRGHGKPLQTFEHGGKSGGPIQGEIRIRFVDPEKRNDVAPPIAPPAARLPGPK